MNNILPALCVDNTCLVSTRSPLRCQQEQQDFIYVMWELLELVHDVTRAVRTDLSDCAARADGGIY